MRTMNAFLVVAVLAAATTYARAEKVCPGIDQEFNIPPSHAWTHRAAEGATFTLAKAARVRYGVDERWIERAMVGIVPCNNSMFPTDPAPGVKKSCQELIANFRPFACAPKPGGDGTWPSVRVSNAGAVAWWYCSDGFSWKTHFSVGTREHLTNELSQAIQTALLQADPVKAINDLQSQRPNTPLDAPEMTAIWCPVWPEIQAGRPAAPEWMVARNGLFPTRPTYAIGGDGMRGPANGRVDVMTAAAPTPCDCRTRTVEGKSVYCNTAAPAAPAALALCVRK